MVKKLAEKGLLKNENATITVLVPRQAVQAEESAAFVERTFGGSLPAFLAAFMGDRKLKDEEAAELTGTAIALDGIAVIVNTANTVDNLTMDQIRSIYVGETTDWADVAA